MTKDEIKRTVPMSEFLDRNGLTPNRAGFIRCPFHKGDNTPSMKVYKDSVYCFGCGWTGDVFKFYQGLYHCDFRTAFLALGGEYEKKDAAGRLTQAQALHDAEIRRMRKEAERQRALWESREATRYYWDRQQALRFTEALYGPDSDEFWCAVGELGQAEIDMARAEEVAEEYGNN